MTYRELSRKGKGNNFLLIINIIINVNKSLFYNKNDKIRDWRRDPEQSNNIIIHSVS